METIGKIEQLNSNNRPKIKVMIRELILAVEEEDKFKKADRVAGLICDALGMENEEWKKHLHNPF